MRTIVIILFFISLFACAHNGNSKEITFSDSHGKHYSSSTVGSTIKKEYDLNEKPKLILLATSNSDLEEFKSQLRIIKEIDAEKFQYLYVIANTETVNNSGYHTSKMDAKKILGNAAFKIMIYVQNGTLVQSSKAVIDKKAILNHLTKNSIGR